MFLLKKEINFMKFRTVTFFISGALILTGLTFLVLHGGFDIGIHFTGGVDVRVRLPSDVTIERIREVLKDEGLGENIQEIGGPGSNEYLVKVPVKEKDNEDTIDGIMGVLHASFGKEGVQLRASNSVNAAIGREMQQLALILVIVSLALMVVYITIRFEFRFSICAVIALVHDVLVTLGFIAMARIPLSIPIIAGLLTIVGYSVNDTIVIFDRIRENRRLMPREDAFVVINRSVNQSLSRTINTSLTTLLAVMALFVIMGEGVVHDMAATLICGFIVGTYSSPFVASASLGLMETRRRPA